MSWKKSYNTVNIKPRQKENNTESRASSTGVSRSESWLPQYYFGSPDRINRYKQYDYMDFDVDVNMALDKTAEFCTLLDEYTKLPFVLDTSIDITVADAEILRHSLKRWCRINDWSGRLFELFRGVLKYGDQVFIRDPDTFVLNWVDMYNVVRVLVNEEEGKVPEFYCVRNLEFNLQDKVATDQSVLMLNVGLANGGFGSSVGGSFTNSPGNTNQFGFSNNNYTNPYVMNSNADENLEYPVDASHIVHISRSQGMDSVWPFGRSILDPVFKPFRQKELMEEAIIIYRVQRSPERLVFKIDTGDMNNKKASEYLDEVKKEYKQKRIPVVDRGNGETIMDTTYSPMSMTEDFYFAQGMDGRGSTVEPLPGGECLTLDTEIMLFNGEKETLSKIIERYQNGEQMWIYSVNPVTQVVIPALVSWAGITRRDTEVIKLKMSDGSDVKVTPDHKFPIKGKGMVEAQDIQIGDEFHFVDFDMIENQNAYYNIQKKEWMNTKLMFNRFFEDFPLHVTYDICFNHTEDFEVTDQKIRKEVKLVEVEKMPLLDTGTITVDGAEFYTANHTFALGNGIFTKNSTGSIDDLKFFTTRMIRSLRVPISYMSWLTEDGQTYTYNDGKNGTAYMEEFSYSEYCKRLQRQIIKPLNREFKLFVKSQGIDISASDFDISLVPPQSFSEYRQIELDTAQMGVFSSISEVSYLSTRFKLKRFLGLSDAEIKENEKLWREENKVKITLEKENLIDADLSVPSDKDIDSIEEDELELMDDDDDGFDLDLGDEE